MTPQSTPRSGQTDVIVVGGGMAGLTAACYLARAGRSVLLLEKASSPGGRATTQNRDGYRFNRGAHALYTGGAASDVFRDLGITYTYGVPKGVSVLRDGKLFPFPSDPLALVRGGLFDPGDKLEFARLLFALSGLKLESLARVSVQEWLERMTRRPRVRQFIAALARTFVYSVALDQASADVVVAKLRRSLRHPIHYIEGGWQTLADGLRRVAEQAGAQIVSGAHVESIEHRAGQVLGVRLRDGTLRSAGAVIVATGPRDAVKLIGDGADPSWRQAMDGLVPVRIACLDVALSNLPRSRYYIVQDLERPRFLTTQSRYVSVAPPGGALVSTFKLLDPSRPSDPAKDERDLEDLLDTTLSGWREALVERVYLPRIEAVGTLPTASSGGLAGRPGPRVPNLANLYLAGDWIGPEGFLIDASLASARHAARSLLADPSLAANHAVLAGSV